MAMIPALTKLRQEDHGLPELWDRICHWWAAELLLFCCNSSNELTHYHIQSYCSTWGYKMSNLPLLPRQCRGLSLQEPTLFLLLMHCDIPERKLTFFVPVKSMLKWVIYATLALSLFTFCAVNIQWRFPGSRAFPRMWQGSVKVTAGSDEPRHCYCGWGYTLLLCPTTWQGSSQICTLQESP